MTIKEFVYKLEHRYCREENYPSSVIEYIRDFEEENNVRFSNIYIGYCRDSSWSDHGYIYEDYECDRFYEADELPEELDKDMYVAGIYYDEVENTISIDFYGDGTTNAEKEEEARYEKYWANVRKEREDDVEYLLSLRDRNVSIHTWVNRKGRHI
jgi:hypothetical protein